MAAARITFTTSAGSFAIELFDADVPKSAARVRALAARGFYDGKQVHRVSPSLVQLGAGASGDGVLLDEAPRAPRKNLAGTVGLVAGARKDERDAELYVNVTDNAHLDATHVPVGRVVEGMDVVTRISQARTSGRVTGERPLTPITITRAR
jgi:cyclophilin family peptidyl-prolyl cis-trans isomerase